MRTETVEVVCSDLTRAHILGASCRSAWKHWLTFSYEVAGHTLRITVTGDADEVERYVAALRYVFD